MRNMKDEMFDVLNIDYYILLEMAKPVRSLLFDHYDLFVVSIDKFDMHFKLQRDIRDEKH